MSPVSVAELQRAHQMLAVSNRADRVVLPSAVADSWERCATALSEFEHGETPIEDSAPRDEGDYRLVTAARGPVEWLVNQFDELIGGVVVADADGRLLRVSYSGMRGRQALERIQVLPGALFGEKTVGTNGIGTPLVARKAVHVTGEQHLRYDYHPYTCAGVPVTDPLTGQLLGMVGIIGWGEQIAHAGGLMKVSLADATRGITNDLLAHPHARSITTRLGPRRQRDPASAESLVWRQAQNDIDASLRRGDNVLVLGEESTGRMTATVDAYRRIHAGAAWTAVQPDEIERRISNRHAPVKIAAGEARQLIVLRDIDRLSSRAVAALTRVLPASAPGLQLAATCSPQALGDRSPIAALLPLFDHTSTVPALRQHLSDLPAIVAQILRVASPAQPKHLDADALATLERCTWPGNLEQLTDVIASAARNARGATIGVGDLARYVAQTDRLSVMERSERDEIVRAYYHRGRNKSQVADALGISRSTLYRKIAAYGIDDF